MLKIFRRLNSLLADRTAEIQRLEGLAKGMRQSYLHANTPPRHPSKQPVSPLNSSPSANSVNGADENHLSVRSPSTSRMITTLQKEMDALKSSSEAARAAAGHYPLNCN